MEAKEAVETVAKHTAGPWTTNEYGDKIAISSEKWEELATVYIPSGTATIAQDRGRANARLIAAAPTLLQACKGLSDHANKQWKNVPVDGRPDALRNALDAIARAEGR
jgi:hypothetical protein